MSTLKSRNTRGSSKRLSPNELREGMAAAAGLSRNIVDQILQRMRSLPQRETPEDYLVAQLRDGLLDQVAGKGWQDDERLAEELSIEVGGEALLIRAAIQTARNQLRAAERATKGQIAQTEPAIISNETGKPPAKNTTISKPKKIKERPGAAPAGQQGISEPTPENGGDTLQTTDAECHAAAAEASLEGSSGTPMTEAGLELSGLKPEAVRVEGAQRGLFTGRHESDQTG